MPPCSRRPSHTLQSPHTSESYSHRHLSLLTSVTSSHSSTSNKLLHDLQASASWKLFQMSRDSRTKGKGKGTSSTPHKVFPHHDLIDSILIERPFEAFGFSDIVYLTFTRTHNTSIMLCLCIKTLPHLLPLASTCRKRVQVICT